MTNPVATRTPWTQVMVFNYHFSIKRTKFPKRNDDSRSGSGNVQNKIKTYCDPRSKEALKSYRVVSKRFGSLLNKFSLAKGQQNINKVKRHNKYIKICKCIMILNK